jgi:hypothetical protein
MLGKLVIEKFLIYSKTAEEISMNLKSVIDQSQSQDFPLH